jgi:hypothetical protein
LSGSAPRYACTVIGWPSVSERAPASVTANPPQSAAETSTAEDPPICSTTSQNIGCGGPAFVQPWARNTAPASHRAATPSTTRKAAFRHCRGPVACGGIASSRHSRTSLRPAATNRDDSPDSTTAASREITRGPRSAQLHRWRGRVVPRGNNSQRRRPTSPTSSAGPSSTARLLATHNTGANLQPVANSITTTPTPKHDSRPWYSPRPRQTRPRRAARLSGSAARYACPVAGLPAVLARAPASVTAIRFSVRSRNIDRRGPADSSLRAAKTSADEAPPS